MPPFHVWSCLRRFLATTASGVVFHRSRFGDALRPKRFVSPDSSYEGFYNEESVARCGSRCVDYCPFHPASFLVGFADGKIGYEVTALTFC